MMVDPGGDYRLSEGRFEARRLIDLMCKEGGTAVQVVQSRRNAAAEAYRSVEK
jgi:hypothetical protein